MPISLFALAQLGPVRASAAAAPCPNEAFRIGPAVRLPDCRAYEMVSPIDKNGGDIETAEQEAGEGSHLASAYRQASLDGNKITYSSSTAFGDAIGGHWSNQYLATRGIDGWSTHSISSRRGRTVLEPQFAFAANLRWYTYGFVQGFTPDLSTAWVRDDNVNPLTSNALNGYVNLYRRDNDVDVYESLITQGPFGPNAHPSLSTQGQSVFGGPRVLGASSDLRHQVFTASAALTPNAIQAQYQSEPGTVSQLYDLVDGELHLVSVLPNGQPASTFSFTGTITDGKLVTTRDQMLKNAVSDDGSRVFWSAVPSGHVGPGTLYVRENPDKPQSPSNDCTEPDKACTIQISEGGEAAQFWAASRDGSRVLYSVGAKPNRVLKLVNVDTGAAPVIAAEVEGVSAAGDDLSHIYFVSREDKTPGAGSVPGQSNLYHFHNGSYAWIGIVSANDTGGVQQQFGGSVSNTANIVSGYDLPSPVLNQTRTTPDGRHFTFMSNSKTISESAADYDNTDLVTSEPDFEVYLYDADTDNLVCASCNPSGARPRGSLLKAPYSPLDLTFTNFPNLRTAASIPTHEHDNYSSRIISGDGKRLFFHSDEALVPKDTNGVQDVYQWQAPGSGSCEVGSVDYVAQNEGCLNLISSGRDGAKSEFVDADPTGEEVFFSTDASLDPRDPGLRDIYVAKVNGGFPLPNPTAPCEGEACQSPPSPPSDPTPASSTFRGNGDPKARPRCPKGKRKIRRNGKVRCVKRRQSPKNQGQRRSANRGAHQ